MKVTIVYDNTSINKNLQADWGFACVIETAEKTILFDTGGNGKILLKNMSVLNISPASIDDVVISHPHFDHIGGLSAFLNANSKAHVHVPVSFRGIRYANEVFYHERAKEIYKNIFVSGELKNIEQALAVREDDKFVLFIGCAHPGVEDIVSAFNFFGKINFIIGGLHGFNHFSALESLEKVCPTHCTRHKEKIQKLYPEKYIEGGAGKVLVL